jgi:SAM-dependent methyltransferase
VSEVDSRLRRFYERRPAEDRAEDREPRARFSKALAAADLRPGERVVDLGAKWGELGLRLREARLEVSYVGFDLSEANVRRAQGYGIEVIQADLSLRLPLEDESADCVFCLELLEHLQTPLDLLREIRRVLAPTGRAVLSVPSPYNWIEIYRELRGRVDPEGHLASLPTPIMLNLLALAGLRLERRLGTFVRLPKTMFLIPTNSFFARSRIYVVRVADEEPGFAGRAA